MAIEEFVSLARDNAHYTVGELMWAVLRPNNSNVKDLRDIRTMKDEEFYNIIYKAREEEREELFQ